MAIFLISVFETYLKVVLSIRQLVMGFQVHFLTTFVKLQNNSLLFRPKKSEIIPDQLMRLKGMGMTWWFQKSKFLTGPVAYFLESSQKTKEG
jgi:hypothetical protein